MAKDQKIVALYKAVKTIKKKVFLKLNHITRLNGKVSKTTKSSEKNIHSCIQAQKNSNNNYNTSSGPDFKIYESDCFPQRTPIKLPKLTQGNRMSTTTYQLPYDFLVDAHEGDLSGDYINICQAPPPP